MKLPILILPLVNYLTPADTSTLCSMQMNLIFCNTTVPPAVQNLNSGMHSQCHVLGICNETYGLEDHLKEFRFVSKQIKCGKEKEP